MKKAKRPRETKPAAAPPKPSSGWWAAGWAWLAALAGLFLVFGAYEPALNAEFVFDDRHLPFMTPQFGQDLYSWISGLRPLLMLSFWIDYRLGSGPDPHTFHATNIFIHFMASTLVALCAGKLLEWAGVTGRQRAVLAVFSGALFLLHPIQTESVAYVASRSEGLSVLFYFAAFAVFLYKRGDSITVLRAVTVVALFGAAAATKEDTLTLPALLLLTDYFWGRGGIRKNAPVYALLAAAGAVGGVWVWRVLAEANTAGFHLTDLTPATYFFTQCRVIWTYVRLFVLPFGQNVDPDVPVSQSPIDHGAIFGLAALAALAVAAWIYRKRYSLAAFGVFVFLLLLAPTSSFIPIRDVLAEHRLYLPSLGLVVVCLEFLRRIKPSQAIWAGAGVLAACAILTYQRSQVWANPLSLWQDTVARSPNKYRPWFQLALSQYEANQCPAAAQSYEKTSQLGAVDYSLLIDWALALDCAGQPDDAIAKLRQALPLGPQAHVYSQMGMILAKHGKRQEALEALSEAEKSDPRWEMTYVYRGGVYALNGDRAAAVREYQRALALNPNNQPARDALQRVSQ